MQRIKFSRSQTSKRPGEAKQKTLQTVEKRLAAELLASQTRLERATPGLGGSCSIQLSYWDKYQKYSIFRLPRTRTSYRLGGVCYIHLTTEAQIKVALNKRPSSIILKSINISFIFLTHHRQSVNSFKSKMSIQIFLSFKLYHTQTRYRRFLDSCRGVRDNDRRRKENIRKRYSEVGQGSALQVSDEINAHFAEQTLSNKNIQIKRNPCHAVG